MIKPKDQNAAKGVEIDMYKKKEKGTLKSENIKYFETKFKCYKVIYFGTERLFKTRRGSLQRKKNCKYR